MADIDQRKLRAVLSALGGRHLPEQADNATQDIANLVFLGMPGELCNVLQQAVNETDIPRFRDKLAEAYGYLD